MLWFARTIREESMRFVATVTLLGLFAGSAAAQPHDATWAQRKIDEAQCRTWALDQARAEYGPQLRQAARQQEAVISAGRYSGSAAQAGVGLAGGDNRPPSPAATG